MATEAGLTPIASATEIAIGINSRMVAVFEISCVSTATETNKIVVIRSGLGLSPRIFSAKSATTFPNPLFCRPVDTADREPIRKRQFQSIARKASCTVIHLVPTMIRAPITAAICIGSASSLSAHSTRTQNRVTQEMIAFLLSRGFLSVWANSGI